MADKVLQALKDLVQQIEDADIEDLEHDYFGCGKTDEHCSLCNARAVIAEEETKELQCWDNGGKTIDRYTVVWPDGSYLGMNAHPFHPQGFGQHGEGCMYFLRRPPAKCHLGRRIKFSDLPEDAKKCVQQDLKGGE